jgi:8-oxo-dGTP diphosphatase
MTPARNTAGSIEAGQGAVSSAAEPTLENLDVRVVVFSLREERLQALLTPSAGVWALPGSRVPLRKSLEETATESVLRLTGLREAYLEQLYTYGETGRTAPGGPSNRMVSVVYFAIIPAGATKAPQDSDAQAAKWFPVEHLPHLAMDHSEVIRYALRRLRYKLEYTALGFQLLPEQFSLSDLQRTYEMILGEMLDKRNFRRRILQAGIIEETPHLRASEGRPARLYRYRPDAVAEVKARRLFP